MKLNADTNVLLRAITGDHPRQSMVAQAALADAEIVAVALPTLCELVWVLARGYKTPATEIAETVRRIIASDNVTANRPAVEAGLKMLEAGGDFADGAIAYEGSWLGADVFVSFDRKAVKLMEQQGRAAKLLT